LQFAPAGLPPDNDTVICPDGGESCYFYYSRSLTWEKAKVACKTNPGAFLISYNSGEEQLLVESYYRATGRLFWYYWFGLEKVNNVYYWWVVLPRAVWGHCMGRIMQIHCLLVQTTVLALWSLQ
jgi:hypothetical protein